MAVSNPQKQSSGSKPFYFYLILVFIPVLFFILLELSLRLFNYGRDNRQWIPASEGKLILNPEVSKRYFSSSGSLPYSIQDVFDENKKPGTFRIFVMGESSAAGYPYLPVGSFSRYIKRRFELFYPELNAEVINISMTAVNSYTLLDLFPGVIEQKPDLVLIYTGHNEYYGALGAASVESFGSSPFFIKLMLKLDKLKTVELIRNTISSAAALFSGSTNETADGTLMSRIARDRYIPLDSELYNAGIEQFTANMSEIFSIARENNTDIICGNLVSNYKDQPPFISADDRYPPAAEIFKLAEERYAEGNFNDADSFYRYAKDLDALRFRAPAEINSVLQSLYTNFGFPLLNIDSVFADHSPDGITGNNLMTDHLHPTLEGYLIIGNAFFETLISSKYMHVKSDVPSGRIQDSITIANFHFSPLDSVIADYRIRILKNDWPYRQSGTPLEKKKLLKPENFIDSTAYLVAEGAYTWEKAQRTAALYYASSGEKDKFVKQVNVLISQYPVVAEFYDFAASELIRWKDFAGAFPYLQKSNELKKEAFSAKWLGTIYLSQEQVEKALYYLKQSLSFKSDDPQVQYNLAGAYIKQKNYDAALRHIEECLRIEPDYPAAAGLKNQLIKYAGK